MMCFFVGMGFSLGNAFVCIGSGDFLVGGIGGNVDLFWGVDD